MYIDTRFFNVYVLYIDTSLFNDINKTKGMLGKGPRHVSVYSHMNHFQAAKGSAVWRHYGVWKGYSTFDWLVYCIFTAIHWQTSSQCLWRPLPGGNVVKNEWIFPVWIICVPSHRPWLSWTASSRSCPAPSRTRARRRSQWTSWRRTRTKAGERLP